MNSENQIEKGKMSKIDRSIRTSTWLVLIFLVFAIVCIGAFNIIGQEVDAQGVLHEAFFLVPMFWLFLFLAAITGLVNVITRIVRMSRRKAVAG